MTGKFNLVKKMMGAALAVIMLLSLAVPAFAQPSPLSEYAVLMDAATGQILYGKNMEDSISPSGLVKIMTALVAAESGTPLTNSLTVTSTALEPLGSSYRGINLCAGEQIALEACLQAMLLDSANDASNVIAEVLGGDIDTFVKNMNDKADALGLENTQFVNPNGLPQSGQETTVTDMAEILRYALSVPAFAQIFGLQEATIPATNYTTSARELITRCRMNRNSSELAFDGSLGGVIGYGSESGYIIATAAVREGRTLIAVVAKSENEDALYSDASALLEYGFSGFTQHTFSGSEFASGEIPVTENGVKVGTAVFSVASEAVTVLLPEGTDPAGVEAVAEALPSAVEKDSEMQYTANICYHHQNGQYEVLVSDLLLTASIKLDEVAQTDASTENSGTIATDEEGNPVTDEAGNVVTGTSTEAPTTEKKGGGFKKFILTFLKVILIIIAVFAGAVLLFILSLVIIKQVKKARKRKARARAAAERAARAAQRQNDRDFY
ncbi:MAG: D-alanyl-D-alanine carboxypeptidase [Clostridia bacterium]|nr:D-alanyl-D-alanine carboxypeptidase [Clostridia bacterium]